MAKHQNWWSHRESHPDPRRAFRTRTARDKTGGKANRNKRCAALITMVIPASYTRFGRAHARASTEIAVGKPDAFERLTDVSAIFWDQNLSRLPQSGTQVARDSATTSAQPLWAV